jgi:hypothetical protein
LRLTLEEDLEYTTGFFIDQTRDTLDTSTTSETTDRRLGDTLDVVTKLSNERKSQLEVEMEELKKKLTIFR